jgi:hypothetical protein
MDPTPYLPDPPATAGHSDLTIGPTGADHEAATRLHGRRLLAARGAWLGIVVLTLGLAIPGFVVAFDRPELLNQPEVLGLAQRLGLPNQVVLAHDAAQPSQDLLLVTGIPRHAPPPYSLTPQYTPPGYNQDDGWRSRPTGPTGPERAAHWPLPYTRAFQQPVVGPVE